MKRRTLAATATAAILVLASAITGLLGATSANAATSQQAFLTFYGWWDNTPPGNGISFPKIHSGAGGVGTWNDPITFASSTKEISAGSKIWVPRVRKYFIMEDDCTECGQDWSGHGPDGGPGLRHYDLWLGGKGGNPFDAINCEDALTNYNDQGPILEGVIANPPSNEPVDSTPIFNTKTGACYGGAKAHTTVGQYKNVSTGQCLNDPGNSSSSGTQLTAAACSTAASEVFKFEGAFLEINGQCAGMSSGKVVLQKCTGGPAQQWSVNTNKTISDIQTSSKCVRQSGTAIVAGSCSGTLSQWNFTSSSTSPPPPPNADFHIGIDDPKSGTIARGKTGTFGVHSSVVSGDNQTLALTVTAPAGVTATISPASITTGGTATVTLKVSSSAATGTVTVSVKAVGSSGTHTAKYTLTIS